MYLDPGFGSMFIQIIVAIIAAGGVIAFSLRKKIRALFSKNKESKPVTRMEEESDGPEDDVIDMLSDENDEHN